MFYMNRGFIVYVDGDDLQGWDNLENKGVGGGHCREFESQGLNFREEDKVLQSKSFDILRFYSGLFFPKAIIKPTFQN